MRRSARHSLAISLLATAGAWRIAAAGEEAAIDRDDRGIKGAPPRPTVSIGPS
jgi:hypothetical protein